MHHLGPDLNEGDVLLTNHPAAGGSHLPDLTVITPVSIQCSILCAQMSKTHTMCLFAGFLPWK